MKNLPNRVLQFKLLQLFRYCISSLPYLCLSLLFITQLPCDAIKLPNVNSKMQWETWSNKTFEKARESDKLILLFIDTNWSHDSHLMRDHTFKHPRITRYIKKQFIPIKVDQDENLYLANRYKKYGVPTVVVFNSVGEELLKRAEFLPSQELIVDLKNIVNIPESEIKRDLDESEILFSERPYLNSSLREQLIYNYKDLYDPEVGGLDTYNKYVDLNTVEYAIYKAKKGSFEDAEIASSTLTAALKLNDPAWGGFYRYSKSGDWNKPSYEKLAYNQGELLSIYSKAYSYFKNIEYIEAAISIHKYLIKRLNARGGVFYSSQDADLIRGEDSSIYFDLDERSRKAFGVPKVDKEIYTNTNAVIANGLTELYKTTNNKQYLEEAKVVANWIVGNRFIKTSNQEIFNWLISDLKTYDFKTFFKKLMILLADGFYQEVGYYHSSNKNAGTYLSDNLDAALAFLNIYDVTQERIWIKRAKQSAKFIEKNYKSNNAGYKTDNIKDKFCVESFPIISTEENVKLVTLATKLFALTKDVEYRAIAEHAMKYLVTPEIALKERTNPGILLAEVRYLKTADLF